MSLRPAPPRLPRPLLWAGGGVAVAVGLLLLAAQTPPHPASAPPPPPPTVAGPAPKPAMAAPALPAGRASTLAATDWPSTGWLAPPATGTRQAPVLSLEELRDIQAALAAAPGADHEQAALAQAMFFVDAAQRFRQLLSGSPAAEPGELQALALLLDGSLDARLQQGDVTPHDARLLKVAVLSVLHPLAAQREQLLADWQARQPASAAAKTAR